MTLRSLLLKKESLLFFTSQILTGGLNYYFQIHAMNNLSVEEFGSWSSWLAGFSVATFISSWAQSFAAINDSAVFLKSRFLFGLSIFLVFATAVSIHFDSLSATMTTAWALTLNCGFLAGIFLHQQRMAALALASVAAALSKFLASSYFDGPLRFHNSILTSSAVLMVFFLLFFNPQGLQGGLLTEIKTRLKFDNILAPLALSLFMAWVPQADILIGNYLLNAHDLGLFSKASLFAKAFFFVFLIVAQIILASSSQKQTKILNHSHFKFLYGIIFISALGGSFISRFLNWQSSWVFFEILDTGLLSFLYLLLQQIAIHRETRKSLQLVGLSFLICGLATVLAKFQFFLGDTLSPLSIFWSVQIPLQFYLGRKMCNSNVFFS